MPDGYKVVPRSSCRESLEPAASPRLGSLAGLDAEYAHAAAEGEVLVVCGEPESGVPETWVRESARSGAKPCVQLGRYVRFDLADVEEWLAGCCKRPGKPIALRRVAGGRPR